MNFCVHCNRFEHALKIGEICCDLEAVASKEWEAFTAPPVTTQLVLSGITGRLSIPPKGWFNPASRYRHDGLR